VGSNPTPGTAAARFADQRCGNGTAVGGDAGHDGAVRSYSANGLADEAGVTAEQVRWLTTIGVLHPTSPGVFTAGDVFRAKMIGALLGAGFTTDQIAGVVAEGKLNLDHVDNYVVTDPSPRSGRSFADFASSLGAGPAAELPALYRTLGLPEPDPSAPIHVGEEALWLAFFEGWTTADDEETPFRAARLIGEGTRQGALGWGKLLEEQIAGPARDRFLRGEVDRYPTEVVDVVGLLIRLVPSMMEWLVQRYIEQQVVGGLVEGFESLLAATGMAPPPGAPPPPAVVFVDIAGYTRLTEERGDDLAVRLAASLQTRAEAVAASRGGRLVKLIGDGAMLRFDDARSGVAAALELIDTIDDDPGVGAHAGVHTGPVVERDRDLFGRTVNLASRLADVASPGQVVVSKDVAVTVHDDPDFDLEPIDAVTLKGVHEPLPLFLVSAGHRPA
jgi:adenylate cyclase